MVNNRLPQDQADDRVFFGGYDWDGSNLYVVPSSKRVFWCRDGMSEPQLKWPNIKNFLLSEHDRIIEFYDDGYPKDENVPTATA